MEDEAKYRYGLVAETNKSHITLNGTGDLYQISDTYVA